MTGVPVAGAGARSLVGTSISRREGPAKLTGAALFTDEFDPPTLNPMWQRPLPDTGTGGNATPIITYGGVPTSAALAATTSAATPGGRRTSGARS